MFTSFPKFYVRLKPTQNYKEKQSKLCFKNIPYY